MPYIRVCLCGMPYIRVCNLESPVFDIAPWECPIFEFADSKCHIREFNLHTLRCRHYSVFLIVLQFPSCRSAIVNRSFCGTRFPWKTSDTPLTDSYTVSSVLGVWRGWRAQYSSEKRPIIHSNDYILHFSSYSPSTHQSYIPCGTASVR